MSDKAEASQTPEVVSNERNNRIPVWDLADKLVNILKLDNRATLLEWQDGPEIEPFWRTIKEGFLNNLEFNTDAPDQAKFLEAFKEARHDSSILNKYLSANFDTTDCTHLDRMVKFSVDALNHAERNGGALAEAADAIDEDSLGILMYMNIDLLVRPVDPRSACFSGQGKKGSGGSGW
ncbi:hypothetical protein diail_7717 [Diaporthe ilicicola]|nr:hypothetical protein diail_7717 [Diaporthe ilicicola]